VNALAAGAVARLGWGDREGAAALVQEALGTTASAGADIRAWNLPDLVRVATGSGRSDLAWRLLAGIHDSLARYRLAVESARAVIAEAEEDPRESEDRYRAVAEAWGAYGHVMERGLSLLGRGRSLLRLRKRDEAETALREARGMLAGLAAHPHVAEADAWLDRVVVGGS